MPPIHNKHFWATQLLVIAIAGGHDASESLGLLDRLGMLYIVPISMFFVPVVYAAASFGLSGALATSLWCLAISLPNIVFFHSGLQRDGVILQMGIINLVGLFVGRRVDAEVRARKRAEAASQALGVSESKYRSLFETAGDAVLLLDETGTIHEANAAAGRLFGLPPASLQGRSLRDLDAEGVLAALAQEGTSTPAADIVLGRDDEVVLEPIATPVTETNGRLTQVVLRNVTAQRRRQAGLETYAAQMIEAQEEERKRIARELHDGTVQELMHQIRKLDELRRDADSALDPRIQGLIELTRSTVRSVRRFSSDLRPSALDDLGLIPAVQLAVKGSSENFPGGAQLAVTGDPGRLDGATELTLFRIMQEALHNVEKHAQATSVTVELEFAEEYVRMSVTDDGRGCELPKNMADLGRIGKLGVMGMRERAALVGGSFDIRSPGGKGCVVTVEVLRGPMKRDAGS